MLIDTHCHLDFPEFDPDRVEVITRAKEQGIDYIVNIGSSVAGSRRSVELTKEYASIYASVGIHPHEADKCTPQDLELIAQLTQEKKVVAIGETGLDYFKNYSGAENQKKLFSALIRLAKDKGLPLVIHSRNAESELLDILKANLPLKAVIHCFSGDEDFLRNCLDLGFLVSFTCNITYKKAEALRRLVKITPLEKLLLETDAPYLSPEGLRGKRNEPMQVRALAEKVAEIKEIKTEEVARVTSENAKQFFKIK